MIFKKSDNFNFFYLYFKLFLRSINEFGISFFFYVIVVCLFPISLGNYFFKSTFLIPCVLWISVLLAILLSLDALYKVEYTNGIFDQYVVNYSSFRLLILIKFLSHWILVVLPLLIITPVLGLFFGMSYQESFVLFCSLLVGTPALVMLGSIGVSLVITLPQGGMLLLILILPLYIPILIFGSSSVLMIGYGIFFVLSNLALLLALSIFCVLISPFIITRIIKLSICV